MNHKIKIILLSGIVGIAVSLNAQVGGKTKTAEMGEVVRVEPGQTKSPYGYVLKMNLKGQKKVPLLISLHGAGGGKNGVTGMGLGEEKTLAETEYAYVLVKPVCPGRWTAEKLDQMIESLKKDYAAVIDTNRIYIYGHSMGGYGSWLYCISHGDKIAAMMSSEGGFIGGTGPISKFDFKHFKTLPVWVFQNTGDKTVPFKYAQELVDAAKAAGGNPKFTVFEMDGHKSHMPEMMQKETLEWLFSQSLEKRKPSVTQSAGIVSESGKERMVRIGEMDFYLMEPLSVEEGKKYPIVLTFHGGGGDYQTSFVKLFATPLRAKYPSYVLSAGKGTTKPEMFPKIMKFVEDLPQIDLNRVYIQGHSEGSSITRKFVTAFPDFFAAAAPASGIGLGEDVNGFENFPIWAFHGRNDTKVPIAGVLKMFENMKKANGDMRLTIFEDEGHGIGTHYFHYDGSSNYAPPGSQKPSSRVTNMYAKGNFNSELLFLDWFFAQSRENRKGSSKK